MLALALVIASCMASGVLLLGLHKAPDAYVRRAAAHWLLGISCIPLGWLLLEWAMRGGPIWLFVVGKTLIMAAFVEILRAARSLRRSAGRSLALHGLSLLVMLATTLWLLLLPNTEVRSSLLSLLCAALAMWAGHEIWTPGNRRSSAFALVVAGGLSIAAAALLLRALHYADPSLGLPFNLPNLPAGLLLGLLLAALTLATVGFALLLSDTHLRRIRELDGQATPPPLSQHRHGAALGSLDR
jgi:multisubunit Na+/H+ antiporter MnhG subunit